MTLSRWTPTGLSGGGATETPTFSPHDPNHILLNCDMSCAFQTKDAGHTWTMFHWSNMLGNPFCAGVFHPQNPKIVYAAYGYPSTLRISRDGGNTFVPHGEGLPGNLRQILIDSAQPDLMLAATETEVFRSFDAGTHWARVAKTVGTVTGLHIDLTSSMKQRRIFLATREAFYRSTNNGNTWTQSGAGLPLLPVRAFTAGSRADSKICRLYAWLDTASADGTSQGVLYRSSNGGTSWEQASKLPVPKGEAEQHRYLLTTDVRPDTLYAVQPARSNEPFVHRSDDAGSTWHPVMFGNKRQPSFNLGMNHTATYFNALAGWTITAAGICPTNPDIVLVSDYCTPYLTQDGGKTWKNLDIHHAPDQGKPANGHRWLNNGLTNTTTWNYYVDPFEHNRHYICYTDLGFARSEDAGKSWMWVRDMGPNTFELAFDPEVPGRIWAAFSEVHDIPNNNIVTGGHRCMGYGIVGMSNDFGATWSDPTLGVPINDERWYGSHRRPNGTLCGGLPQTPITSVFLDPTSPRDRRCLYASAWEHGVYRSDDSGKTWTSISNGLGAPGVNMRVCRVRLHADGTLFCLVTGKLRDHWLMPEGVGLYASTDHGVSWHNITSPLDVRWLTDFEVDPRDSRAIYLAVCDDPSRGLKEGGLYKTLDRGQGWERLVRYSALHFSASIHPRNPDWIYLTLNYNEGKASPLWLSKDAGKTWKPFEDYPFCSAHRVHVDPVHQDRIYVTGYGGSAWVGPLEP